MSDRDDRDRRPETTWQDTNVDSRLSPRLAAGKEWLLVRGGRLTIAGLLSLAVFGLTMLVGAHGPSTVEQFLTGGVSPASAFVELMKTIVALVTIVLSINQLVLSPELGSAGDQRSRLEDSMALRQRAESALDESVVAPSSPAEFLRVVLEAIDERAVDLAAVPASGEARAERDALVADVRDEVAPLLSTLDEARYGEFEVVPAAVAFDISEKVRRARVFERDYGGRLTAGDGGDESDGDRAGDDGEGDGEAVDDLVDALKLFATARAYLKTTFIRSEYIQFSRALLYLGLPALLFTFYVTQLYGPGVFPGTTLGYPDRLWVVAVTTAVALSPFALLISYVSRLATISQSTLFVGPFTANRRSEER